MHLGVVAAAATRRPRHRIPVHELRRTRSDSLRCSSGPTSAESRSSTAGNHWKRPRAITTSRRSKGSRLLEGLNKKLFLQIQDRFFEIQHRNVPAYLLEEPVRRRTRASNGQSGREQARRPWLGRQQWNPKVQERFQASSARWPGNSTAASRGEPSGNGRGRRVGSATRQGSPATATSPPSSRTLGRQKGVLEITCGAVRQLLALRDGTTTRSSCRALVRVRARQRDRRRRPGHRAE